MAVPIALIAAAAGIGSAMSSVAKSQMNQDSAKPTKINFSYANLNKLGSGESQPVQPTQTQPVEEEPAPKPKEEEKSGNGLSKVITSIASILNKGKDNSDIGSDERLKAIFSEDCPIDCFARIHSYVFRYKPSAQEMMHGRYGVDNDIHYGVMAQELEDNPFTRSTVHSDPITGAKVVDTKELTMANTAAISDIMKELQELRAFKQAVVSAMNGGM